MTETAPLSGPGVEALVRRVIDVINAARPMPLSTSVMVSRDEIVDLLEAALTEFPKKLEKKMALKGARRSFVQSEGRRGTCY